MTNLFVLIIAIYLCISSGEAEIYNNASCTDNTHTYVLNITFHIQNEIKDAIVSLVSKSRNSNLLDSIQSINGEPAALVAVSSYFGTILDEMNVDLQMFNVQLNMNLDELELHSISANGSYDPSCEVGTPIIERTTNAFNDLTAKMNNTIGLHLFLFGCVYNDATNKKVDVISNGTCGRAIGVMWDGSTNTKTLIKSAIMEAINAGADTYANGYITPSVRGNICSYFDKCLKITPTIHGQLLNSTKALRYIDEEDSTVHVVNEVFNK